MWTDGRTDGNINIKTPNMFVLCISCKTRPTNLYDTFIIQPLHAHVCHQLKKVDVSYTLLLPFLLEHRASVKYFRFTSVS
jgi:hypothetical protein